jgi:hypothetical protein
MHPINSIAAEFKAIGRDVTQITSVSLIIHETDYLPKLIIYKKLQGWEVHTEPKRIIITFKEIEAKQLIQKLAKANYLSEQLKFSSLL